MKKYIIAAMAFVAAFLFSALAAQAATILFPVGGGTGTSTLPTSGQVLVGNSGGTYSILNNLPISSGGTSTTTFYAGGLIFSDGTELTQAPNTSTNSIFWDNTNGRLGIDTGAPTVAFQVFRNSTQQAIIQRNNTTGTARIDFAVGSGVTSTAIGYVGANRTDSPNSSDGDLVFGARTSGATVEIARLTGLGLLELGSTTQPTHTLTLPNAATGIALYGTVDQTTNYSRGTVAYDSGVGGLFIRNTHGGSGSNNILRIQSDGSTVGTDYVNLTLNRGSTARFFNVDSNATSNVTNPMASFTSISSAAAGVSKAVSIEPTLTQSGSAGYAGIQILSTETSLGSGLKLLLKIGTSTSADLFDVDNTGLASTTQLLIGGLRGTAAGSFLAVDATGKVIATTTPSGSGGAVSSVSNADSTLTISPTTGAVVASLNLANPNTWTGLQQFNGNASSTQLTTTGNTYLATTGGNVGVGTTTAATYPFSITSATSPQLAIVNSAGNYATVAVSATGALTLANNGSGSIVLNTSNNTNFMVAGATRFTINGNTFIANNAAGPELANLGASATVPTFMPNKVDTTTGIGADASGNISLITAATTKLEVLNTGNVGIGTSTPFGSLQIASSSTNATFKSQLILTDTAAATNTKHWLLSSINGNFSMNTSTDAFSVTSPPAFSMTNDGLIGIGILPQAGFRMDMTNGPNISTLTQLETKSTDSTAYIETRFKNSAGAGLGFGMESTGGGVLIVGDSPNAFIIRTGGTGPVQFSASGSLDMTLDTNGYLGVGTSSPAAKLSIGGINATTNLAFLVATSSAAGTQAFAIDRGGHIVNSGPAPVISSCGTTPTIAGDDKSGTITTGSGVVSACTMTFAKAYTDNPVCTVSTNNTSALGDISSVSTSAITFAFTGTLASGKVYYICQSHH